MPAKSKKQYRFMQAVAHGWKPSEGGPSKAQAKEYVAGQSPKELPESAEKSDDFPTIGADRKINQKIDRPKATPAPAAPKPAAAPKPLKSAAGIRGKLVRSMESDQAEIEKLLKAFERRDDYTLVDPREYYGALQAVSDRVMGWVTDAVKGMKVNEQRNHNLPVEGAVLKVRKLAGDMYSGWIIDKSGDINHLYDRLTLPALASQVMAVYEVYDKEKDEKKPSLRTLKDEIELLNSELRNVKAGQSQSNIEERLKGLVESLDKLTDSSSKQTEMHDKLVDRTENELNSIHTKLQGLRSVVGGQNPPKDEPEMANMMAVRRVGEPGLCNDCSCNPCQCYTHLTKPTIEIEPSGKITIMFKSDWQNLDKTNFLHTMKMVVDKKKK